MDPQIVDNYNEIQTGVNIIKEFGILQKENNILKTDLSLNNEYGRPTVEYSSEEELEIFKNKIYKNLKEEIWKLNGNIGERTIKNVLYKLIPNYYEAKIKFNVGLIYECERLTETNWVY
tara:strand:- start:456 stop:812 length:357 start_codon:yes stop_codon:yes gene_type:complete